MKGEFFTTILVGLAMILSSPGPDPAEAQTSPSGVLTGQVSSQEEGPMEGVLVSAKRAGSTVTITVVTDAQGRYSFPGARLEPGSYSLRIRAVGYELNDPAGVEITAERATRLDLKLRVTRDLASQLSNAEWLMSLPGTEEHKKRMLRMECQTCHTLQRIVLSRHDANGYKRILPALGMKRWKGEQLQKNSEYMSTIKVGPDTPLKTLPRPKGKATRVIITEYDLPRPGTEPHDVVMGSEGMVWYADFREQYIGKLDPKTAKVVEWSVPLLDPKAYHGSKDVRFDRDGNVWLDMDDQGAIAKFDKNTEKFQIWRIPTKDVENGRKWHIGAVVPQYRHVDGKVWTKFSDRGEREEEEDLRGVARLDVQSGEIETVNPDLDIPKDSPAAKREHSCYGIVPDTKNNAYCMSLNSEYIIKVDAKTRKATYYQTPTFDSGPRRGHMDSQERLWFAEFRANKIGMFDTKTEQFQEWALPTPWSNPYDVIPDKNGEVWAGGMHTDRVSRLNPKTGEVIEYLLSRSTNIRRVDVDNSTTPVTFWVGNNHGASIVKLEPLE